MRRRSDVVWRHAPEFLALSREGRDVTAIHGPAADVWQLLAEPISSHDIVTALASRYSAPVDVVRADVEALLTLLHEQGYVADETGPGGIDDTR